VTLEGDKRIAIYCKTPIAAGEELTYDYKFPLEDERLDCLCGAPNCRLFLN
jgi:[histone H3]-lysine4 N-trimethyltransferase SETD1